jgi:hypothetical protein
MHLFQILLPRADNRGQPFQREDFDRVKAELAAQFEGVTAYLQAPAEGLWRKGADSDVDEIVIFEVMTEKSTCPIGATAALNWSGVSGRTGSLSATCR